MLPSSIVNTTKCALSKIISASKIRTDGFFCRGYAKQRDDGCRKAIVDIPPEVDPVCPVPCERRKKRKDGILHKIKLKVMEGGSNFGTPFRRIQCQKKICEEVEEPEPVALPPPERKVPALPPPRPGVQVSVLGADTPVGQYIALLLKQCPCIKKLRLYEAKDSQCSPCTRDLYKVVEDLKHIDTNCLVQAFSCACHELERCLQNTDIVLMLDSGYINIDMPFEKRFCYQAPIVKRYADVIANECPKAFVIVCATPIDCMVPLIAETMKETGWYDPRKLLGSLAVPEMRASTLAARALCLEPIYTRVPCVGGTEGESLVPLFSKALDYFDFTKCNAELMTETVRNAPLSVSRLDGNCVRAAELSEAHALAGLVTKVAWALVCKDVPRVTGFVETDASQVISPARFISNPVEIWGTGISKCLGLPKMSELETTLMNLALNDLCLKQEMVHEWYCKYCSSTDRLDAYQTRFFTTKNYERFEDCAYANIQSYLALDVLLNDKGICKKFDFPCKLTPLEVELVDEALSAVTCNVDMALQWYQEWTLAENSSCDTVMQKNFHLHKHYDRIDDCTMQLT